MYEFRPATDRIKLMRLLIRDRVIEIDTERVITVTEAYKKYAKVPRSSNSRWRPMTSVPR